MNTLKAMLPEIVRNPCGRAIKTLRSIYYRGNNRLCPICGNSCRKFRTRYKLLNGRLTRHKDAGCPRCGAQERHRLLWVFVQHKSDLLGGNKKSMLHIAPERCFEPSLNKYLGTGYLTADLCNPRAMVKMDITSIQYPDRSFDVIWCSHVLEHVQDDKQAMKEIHRVLRDDGWAILLVPITAEKTIEDPSVMDPKERKRLFGQIDHVRRYGRDYVERLREAGFSVEVFTARDLADSSQAKLMGLTPGSGEIYYCKKSHS